MKFAVFTLVLVLLAGGTSAVQYIDQAGGANLSIGNSNNIFIDNTNNRVGIFDTTPAQPLDITGNIAVAGTTVITSSRVLRAQNGNVGTAAISFSSDTDTGLYRIGADQLGVTAGGTLRVVVNSTGLVLPSGQLVSLVSTGTAPFTVASTTLVSNLNSDLLDGQEGSYYQNASNLDAGTVATGRISGSYTGITGVGTIATGTWQGTAITNAYVADAITVSGGTLGSNTISSGATWTTAGTLTIGDGGDRIDINSNTWDVTNGAISGVTTIDTGQGATEVYLMNQNVRTSDSPSFTDITASGGQINIANVAGDSGLQIAGSYAIEQDDTSNLIINGDDAFTAVYLYGGTANTIYIGSPSGDTINVRGTLQLGGNVIQDSSDEVDINDDLAVTGAINGATINTGSGAMELGDAAVTDGDTNSIPTNDQVYDFVAGLGYLSGEADTLATVTARGATTATAVSFTSVSNPGVSIGNGSVGYLDIGASGWYDDGTYLSPIGSRPFYIRDAIATTYLYSANTYLGSQTGDTIHTRGSTLNFGDTTYNTTMNVHLDGASNDVNFFYGGTQVGQISAQDTTWFRLNQDIARNIYTPRYIRADSGLYVSSSLYGVNSSGGLIASGLTISSGTVSLPANQIDSSEVSFNYAGSSSKGGAATTATALAANPANCAAGNYPLGVAANGAVESCTADDDTPDSDAEVPNAITLNGGTISGTNTVSGTWNTAATLTIGDNGDRIDINSNTWDVTNGVFSGGTWQGTAIGDSYISSAATWNAKAGTGNCAAGQVVMNTTTSGVQCVTDDDTPDSDAEVPNAITLNGGTISGTNTVSGTWNTAATLTIGDNGDRIDINSNTWDVTNGAVSGVTTIAASSTVTGSAFLSGDGSLATPGFRFSSDPDNGLYRVGTNNISIVAGGTGRVNVDGASGNVVITVG